MERSNKKALRSRCVYLYGEIEEKNTSEVIQTVHELDMANNELPINLFLSTEGGLTYDAFGLYDVLRSLASPVHIYCIGKVMSAGTVILQAADLRIAYNNTRFMVHSVHSGGEGHSNYLEVSAKENSLITDEMAHLYHTTTNYKTITFWRRRLMLDYYFGTDEALKMGFIDKIIF